MPPEAKRRVTFFATRFPWRHGSAAEPLLGRLGPSRGRGGKVREGGVMRYSLFGFLIEVEL